MYVHILKVGVNGFVLQWNDRESNNIKSPALLFTLISLHTGY